MENTYWTGNGKFEEKVEILHEVIDNLLVDTHIPQNGKKFGKHYHIDSFRRAKNAYYRMYNDGDFPRTFAREPECRGMIAKDATGQWYTPARVFVEEAMDRRIESAWTECLENGYVRWTQKDGNKISENL